MPPPLTQIQQLHATYRLLTGLALPLDSWREHQWYDWLQKGHTEDDLRTVIRYLRAGIADQTRQRGALRFHNLIGQIDLFQEDLADARARHRGQSLTPARDAALRAIHHAAGSTDHARSAAQVTATLRDPAAASAALAALQKLRDNL